MCTCVVLVWTICKHERGGAYGLQGHQCVLALFSEDLMCIFSSQWWFTERKSLETTHPLWWCVFHHVHPIRYVSPQKLPSENKLIFRQQMPESRQICTQLAGLRVSFPDTPTFEMFVFFNFTQREFREICFQSLSSSPVLWRNTDFSHTGKHRPETWMW